MPNSRDQIAIIGAGIAGLYSALRLCDIGYRPDKITIYEASQRIGGRILTAAHPDHPSIISDLGARIIKDDHLLVHALVKRFGLTTCPAPFDFSRQQFLLRGKWKTERQIRRSYFTNVLNYNVQRNVQRRSPRRILDRALEKLESRQNQNLPPVSLDQFWAESFDGEEVQFLSDRIGYSFMTEQLNAEVTLPWMRKGFFGGSFCGLSGGMSRLISTMFEELQRQGVHVKTGHHVNGLTFERDGQLIDIRSRKSNGTEFSTKADRVLIALSPKAFMRITGLPERPEFKAITGTVRSWPIATASILYKTPWWRSLDVEGAGFCTDGVLGHLSFFAPAGNEDGRHPARINLYADGWRNEFWQAAQQGESPETWLGSESGFLRAFDREIAKIFSTRIGKRPPAPQAVIFQNWHDGPVGAGIHLWNAESQPEAVIGEAVVPVWDLPIHLCNEAWSLRHGWMEGALESVENMLTLVFRLERQ